MIMAIFAIVALEGFPNTKLPGVIESQYPEKFHKISDGHWLIVDGGTAQTVSQKLGLLGEDPSIAIVYNVAGYFGRAPHPVWEWLKANGGAVGG